MKIFVARVLVTGSALWLMSLCVSASAQSEFQDRFVGSWVSNKEKTFEHNENHQELDEGLLEFLPKLRLQVFVDGAYKAQTEGLNFNSTANGNWKLLEEIDENTARAEFLMKDEEQETTEVFIVKLLEGDTVVLTREDDDTVVVCDRVNEETESAVPSNDG